MVKPQSYQMSMPSREVLMPCPGCGLNYFISQRAAIRFSRGGFEEAYINEVTTSVCPHCGFRADLPGSAGSTSAPLFGKNDFI